MTVGRPSKPFFGGLGVGRLGLRLTGLDGFLGGFLGGLRGGFGWDLARFETFGGLRLTGGGDLRLVEDLRVSATPDLLDLTRRFVLPFSCPFVTLPGLGGPAPTVVRALSTVGALFCLGLLGFGSFRFFGAGRDVIGLDGLRSVGFDRFPGLGFGLDFGIRGLRVDGMTTPQEFRNDNPDCRFLVTG